MEVQTKLKFPVEHAFLQNALFRQTATNIDFLLLHGWYRVVIRNEKQVRLLQGSLPMWCQSEGETERKEEEGGSITTY